MPWPTRPRLLLLDEIGAGLTDAEAAVLLADDRGDPAPRGSPSSGSSTSCTCSCRAIDRLVCMDAGRVIAEGDPAAVMSDAAVIDAYLGTRVA